MIEKKPKNLAPPCSVIYRPEVTLELRRILRQFQQQHLGMRDVRNHQPLIKYICPRHPY